MEYRGQSPTLYGDSFVKGIDAYIKYLALAGLTVKVEYVRHEGG
jgi:hypothetical protein